MDMEFEQFKELMKQTTENLKKMNQAQSYMRWQFGSPEWYKEFVSALYEAEGWTNSHC